MADPRKASAGQGPRMVMGPPETPSRVMQASPNMFPSLQFSPEMFSHATFAPATAPAYPQQRLFWDPDMQTINSTVELSPYQNHFAMSPGGFDGSFTSTTTVIPPFDPSHQLPSQPFDQPGLPTTMAPPYVEGPTFPGPFSTSPLQPPPRDDNPSMFLSSPARRFTNDNVTALLPGSVLREKPAYHHQMEESRREREAKRQRKVEIKHPSITRSVMEALKRPVSPVKDTRPGLKRSLTHSGVGARQAHLRHQSHVSFLDNVSTHSGSTNRSGRNGRSSPIKSLVANTYRNSLTGRTSKRTSLSLSIDENGVARTVVTKAPEDSDIDLDDDTESDVSSRDESDFHILKSQQNSFAFADDDDMPDLEVLPGTRLPGHSKHSSYSTMTSRRSAMQSSQASSTYSAANARVPTRSNSHRKPAQLDMMHERGTHASFSGPGDAQQALKAMLQDRSRSASTQEGSVSSHQSVQFNSSPPMQQNQFANFNISPTTITDPDLATPSTDRDSYASNSSTRCVCNSAEASALMIQCDSCTKWLHGTCVGIDSHHVPEVYVCMYCSQTPMRGGRIRDPRRSSMTITASPLAHKGSKPYRGR